MLTAIIHLQNESAKPTLLIPKLFCMKKIFALCAVLLLALLAFVYFMMGSSHPSGRYVYEGSPVPGSIAREFHFLGKNNVLLMINDQKIDANYSIVGERIEISNPSGNYQLNIKDEQTLQALKPIAANYRKPREAAWLAAGSGPYILVIVLFALLGVALFSWRIRRRTRASRRDLDSRQTYAHNVKPGEEDGWIV